MPDVVFSSWKSQCRPCFSPGWSQIEDFQLYEHCLIMSASKAKGTRWELTNTTISQLHCWLCFMLSSCVFRLRTWGCSCRRWRTGLIGCSPNCSLKSSLIEWRSSARRRKCRLDDSFRDISLFSALIASYFLSADMSQTDTTGHATDTWRLHEQRW